MNGEQERGESVNVQPDVLLRQLQQHLNQSPIANANDHIQSLRQQLLLQQLQHPNTPGREPLPSELLTKLLVQLQTQQTQIDQMKTIIEQMRSIIENQQQMIQGYQEQHNTRNINNPTPINPSGFRQITVEDFNTPIPQRPSSAERTFVNETCVEMSSFQQLNDERRASINPNNIPQKKKRKRKEDGEETNQIDEDQDIQTQDMENNNKTLVYRGLPKRKNMKKTEFNVSKWTLK